MHVHILMHSHVDPGTFFEKFRRFIHTVSGWLETFEDYFDSKVRQILNNAVDSLHDNPRLR